jgi:hypothetical protein
MNHCCNPVEPTFLDAVEFCHVQGFSAASSYKAEGQAEYENFKPK